MTGTEPQLGGTSASEARRSGQTDEAVRLAADAITTLGNGFLSDPLNSELRLRIGSGQLDARSMYRQLVCLAYRILFLELAERRRATPLYLRDDTSEDRFTAAESLGVSLEDDDAAVNAEGTDLWHRLSVITESLASAEPEDTLRGPHPDLWANRFTPDLLGPAQAGGLPHASLRNGALVSAVRSLAQIGALAPGGTSESSPGTVIATIYESLLGMHPEVSTSPPFISLASTSGHDRKSTGAYYTPDALIEYLLDSALEPVIDERLTQAREAARAGGHCPRAAAERALLGITVCDPSVGTGLVLIAAARRLADRLARVRSGDAQPSPDETRRARGEVIRRCLFGVDVNPMAAEICTIALWLEADEPWLSPQRLRDHIKVGNALLGATPDRPASGDQHDRPLSIERARFLADAWCAAFVWSGRDDAGPAVFGTKGDPHALAESICRDLATDSELIGPDLREEIRRVALEHGFFHWHLEFPDVLQRGESTPVADQLGAGGSTGFDVVVGNPPFLNQLETTTAAGRGPARLLDAVTNGAVRGYADLSAAFLLLATRLCTPGGRVALVQPQSLLSTASSRGVRSGVLERASLTHLWVSNESVFDGAAVLTCAPTLRRDGPRVGDVLRRSTLAFIEHPSLRVDADRLRAEPTWAPLAAAALGIPEFAYESEGTIEDLAAATADFRDQYYGLDGFLVEHHSLDVGTPRLDADYPPIITTGLVDLAASHWGQRATRILKRRWLAPRIDRRRMIEQGTLGDWILRRQIPKILLATQTRVIEVFVDEAGRFVPSLPLITVTPRSSGDLWRVAAAMASPVNTAIALQRYSGAALSAQAIKLSAAQALALPAPHAGPAWGRSADLLREAHACGSASSRRELLIAAARTGVEAYRVGPRDAATLLDWWCARLR